MAVLGMKDGVINLFWSNRGTVLRLEERIKEAMGIMWAVPTLSNDVLINFTVVWSPRPKAGGMEWVHFFTLRTWMRSLTASRHTLQDICNLFLRVPKLFRSSF